MSGVKELIYIWHFKYIILHAGYNDYELYSLTKNYYAASLTSAIIINLLNYFYFLERMVI